MSEVIDPATGEPYVPPPAEPVEEPAPHSSLEPTPAPPPEVHMVVRHISTAEVSFVSDYSEDRYPPADFAAIGEPPAGVERTYVRVENDALVIDYSSMDAPLHAKIDRDAGEFRKNFITDVPGQQATYQEKEREARAYKADPATPGLLLIPAEAAARGITDEAMADMVISIADQWKPLNAKIEAKRIEAKEAVTAATTPEGKLAAATVDWAALNVAPA